MTHLDETAEGLPAARIEKFERMAVNLGHTRCIRTFTEHGELYVTRLLTGELHIGRKIDFPPHPLITPQYVRPDIETIGPELWGELEAGADTPEKRLALAYSMLNRLPCGECRTHWNQTLERRPPPVETAEAFDRWQWREHNRVNKRKGKPHFAWKRYAHKKK